MANYGTYCDRSELKTAIKISDTDDDARLLDALERASRWIDNQTGRHFSVRSETRYFTPTRADRLLIDDLLSVTTLKTDEDSDLDYDDTWTSGDYLLHPRNTWPKLEIKVHPDGDYDFPTGLLDSVQIAGLWGHGDGQSATPYEDSGTDTAEELDATETGVDVVSGAALAVGLTMLVELEQMYVTAIASNTATVKRGVNGTTAATHATSKDIYIYRYPDDIVEATLLRAAQLFYGINAPFNMIGEGGTQTQVVPAQAYARIMDLINPFRRVSVG